MKRSLPVFLFIALVLALGAAACGAAQHAVPPPSTSTGASTASTSTVSSSTTTSPGSGAGGSTAPAPPAGGPVPRGFVPVSFTAISASEFWLLGTAPCSNPVCTSLVRTTDGGAHFVGLPAPVEQLAGAGTGTGTGLSDLRFANPRDGFAGPDGSPGQLWETHDGGAHWRVSLSDAMTFTVSGDRVYALTAACTNGTCSHLALRSSPADTDAWESVALPLARSEGFPTITAHGSSVWISLSPASLAGVSSQTLAYSSDGGRTLAKLASPCVPGLGGHLEASSAQVVWAVCPTGMMAGAWRSTDAGAHWSALSQGRLPLANSAHIAPTSDSTALIATGDQGQLVRTTDGGATFTTVLKPGSNFQSLVWFGFTDPETGSALIESPTTPGAPSKVPALQLWRSHDGGVSWHGPVAIG